MLWKAEIFSLAAVLIPLAGGFLVSLDTRDAVKTWFTTLLLPSWHPPYWLFAPVWTFLYLSMGYASYLVWRDGNGFHGTARWPIILYIVQLLLNWAWPPVFFMAHELTVSAVLITFLTVMVIITCVAFFRVNRFAGLLFVPYITWLTFATCLNWRICIDNTS